jgi:hypothetical protein
MAQFAVTDRIIVYTARIACIYQRAAETRCSCGYTIRSKRLKRYVPTYHVWAEKHEHANSMHEKQCANFLACIGLERPVKNWNVYLRRIAQSHFHCNASMMWERGPGVGLRRNLKSIFSQDK